MEPAAASAWPSPSGSSPRAHVVITARKKETLDEAVAHLGGPSVALGIAGKADDLEHQADTVRQALWAFGSLDLLVNNTGINPAYGQLVDLDLGVARKVIEVNSLACSAPALP
ncbi:SDR family NAD(P)-dependent oxidoreductase [Nocardioides immobilis]|uniref:SDR family NAD(P)-dependent oxidoreductase n=1 Tax=Nocardioides immobilis TaxID=2049295 RepID=UPI00319DB4FC